MFAEIYNYDTQLRYEGREEGLEEGREEGLELSVRIISELRENVPIPKIVEKYSVTVRQIEKLKEAFAV